MKMIVASKNKGKLKEIQQIFNDLPYEIFSMEDVGITEEIEENGSTFDENALIKARRVCQLAGMPALADDSGLEVDYLGGAPGIYSARYAGEGASDADKNAKLLTAMEGVPETKRGARFRCSIAVVFPDGREIVSNGILEGKLTKQPKGDKGFGYDPLLYIPEFECTVAELSSDIKNKISHRGRALKEMFRKLKEIFKK